MLSSGVWCSQVLYASPWGSPDREARHVSSWGIRMELLRIATRGIAHSTRERILFGRPSIFSIYLTTGWEKKTFQLPRSNMSGSSDRIFHIRISHNQMGEKDISTSPVRHIRILWALTRRVFLSLYSDVMFSWSFLIFPTNFLRYFALDIWCLNPQTLLVTHLS